MQHFTNNSSKFQNDYSRFLNTIFPPHVFSAAPNEEPSMDGDLKELKKQITELNDKYIKLISYVSSTSGNVCLTPKNLSLFQDFHNAIKNPTEMKKKLFTTREEAKKWISLFHDILKQNSNSWIDILKIHFSTKEGKEELTQVKNFYRESNMKLFQSFCALFQVEATKIETVDVIYLLDKLLISHDRYFNLYNDLDLNYIFASRTEVTTCKKELLKKITEILKDKPIGEKGHVISLKGLLKLILIENKVLNCFKKNRIVLEVMIDFTKTLSEVIYPFI